MYSPVHSLIQNKIALLSQKLFHSETGDPARLPAQVAGRWGLISEKVCDEDNNILYWADYSSQGRTKNFWTGTTSPTNQPRKDPFHMYSRLPLCLSFNSQNHRVHRVAIATFWQTFHHDCKISPAWWGEWVHALPLSLYLPSQTKLWYTLQLRGQIHFPYFSDTLIYMYSMVRTLFCRHVFLGRGQHLYLDSGSLNQF